MTEHEETAFANARERLLKALAGDRSLATAMSALISCADGSGETTLDVLALAYRDAFLDQRHREGHDVAHESGLLSMEEVRSYLSQSVLPRLSAQNLVVVSGPGGAPSGSLIRVPHELWTRIGEERSDLLEAIRMSGEHPSLIPPAHSNTVATRHSLHTSEPDAGPDQPNAVVAGGSVLSAKGLTKAYRGRKVVNDVALEVRQGEIVGLLGPNGAGKTTTFYMLVGLISPQHGRIFLDGTDITRVPMYQRARRGIGYLSQEPSVFRKLSVEDNILTILETLPISKDERRRRLESLLNELNIAHLSKSRAFQLSGGERRRLEITRALVTEPKFMMLDEPFAGVDPIAVHDIQSIVADLRTRGIGVLISDHNVEQTLDIVDRAYIMFEGAVQVSGTVSELVYDPLVSERYLGPTLTARLRSRIAASNGSNDPVVEL